MELEFLFDKKTRQRIASIRVLARGKIYKNTLDFYGLRLIKPEHMEEVQRIASEADEELKKIHKSLYARAVFIPIDEKAAKKGELYREIINAIRYHIYQTVFQRLKKVDLHHLHGRTKKALLRMCERLEQINVLDDPEIDRHIQEIREKIHQEDLKTLVDEVKAEVNAIRSRFMHLEI